MTVYSSSKMDVIHENPEAIFDFLTIRSLQDRYSQEPRRPPVKKSTETEAIYQNDAEFETYVQQFPIDDSIAECFALASETDAAEKQTSKFVSGGKRPQVSSKYTKLKKKFGWKQSTEEDLPGDDEYLSRDSKRSKKGGVFSKRHKWRGLGGTKKPALFSSQSASPNNDDVKEEVPSRAVDFSPHDSNSISDSQITSYSETLTLNPDDQIVPLIKGDNSRLGMQGLVNYGADILDENDNFYSIFNGDTTRIIQNLEDIHMEEATQLRDGNGDTLLHHAVVTGNPDAVKFILGKYPEMTSDMNNDNITAIEVAAKLGKHDCLKVMLDRSQRRNSPGPSLLNRLLNISAQHGQAECLNLLLCYMSRDPQSASSLPGDNRGNTAAHLAAKNGHLHCLQILLAAGYDVTSENLIRQRPLHIAHQSRHETCFSYLLLLDVCEELLRMLRGQQMMAFSQGDVTSGLNTTVEQINNTLNRYNALLSSSRQTFDESRDNIFQTLSKLQSDLDLFIKHTDCDTAYKRKAAREKLEEFQSEIERLEDLFEFSPMSKMGGTVDLLLADIETTLKPLSTRIPTMDTPPQNLDVSASEEELGHMLSALIKDVYKEYMLENWNVDHVFEKYLGALKSKNGSDITGNTSSELDTSGEKISPMATVYQNTTGIGYKNLRTAKHKDQTCQTALTEKYVCEKCHETVSENAGDINDDVVNECLNRKRPDEKIEDTINVSLESHGALKDIAYPKHNRDTVFARTTSDSSDAMSDSIRNEQSLDFEGDSVREITPELPVPTERPFAKLLSLDERMDLLISGERSKVKHSDSSDTLIEKTGSPEAPESMYTTTFTSITSESTSGLSEWYSKLGFSSLETSPDDVTNDVTNDVTSETPSYWWDTCADRDKAEKTNNRQHDSDSFQDDVRRQIHLDLENEDLTYEELRRNRLLSHLYSVQQTKYPSGHYTERITTASGEVIGGFPSSSESTKIVVDVNGALQRRNESKRDLPPRNDTDQQLYTLEDAIHSNQSKGDGFYGRYNVRSRDLFEAPPNCWEDMSYTDDDDSRSIPWYEIEEINKSIRWKSDTETSDGTVTPQSYV